MQGKKETNNYEVWCEQWRNRFLQMEQTILLQRLTELRDEGQWLTLTHFGRKFGVHKTGGQIAAWDGLPVSCCEKLNIYTLFGYVSAAAQLTGRWVKFDQLKDAAPFSKAFQAGIIAPFSRTFQGRKELLEQALQALQGRKLTQADVGYEVDAFACIPMRFLFWEADDEFPAQGNLLFDASATDFIHVESIVTIATLGVYRLAQAAGVPLDRSCFPMM